MKEDNECQRSGLIAAFKAKTTCLESIARMALIEGINRAVNLIYNSNRGPIRATTTPTSLRVSLLSASEPKLRHQSYGHKLSYNLEIVSQTRDSIAYPFCHNSTAIPISYENILNLRVASD